jgi:hypothetical protein
LLFFYAFALFFFLFISFNPPLPDALPFSLLSPSADMVVYFLRGGQDKLGGIKNTVGWILFLGGGGGVFQEGKWVSFLKLGSEWGM